MRIVIDMQGAQSHGNRHRGIGRYVFEFAKGMCRNRGEHEIVLALNAAYPDAVVHLRNEFRHLLPAANIRTWHAPGPLHHMGEDSDGRRKIAERIRVEFLNSLRPSVVINGAVFESISEDSVVTVESREEGAQFHTAAILYDLIPLIRPKEYLANSTLVEKWYLRHLEELKKCDFLLAISESTKQEAIEHLRWPASRIANISSAVSANFYPQILSNEAEKTIREKFGLSKPFVMYTGGMDQRKNVEGLVKAFSLLPESQRLTHQLAIVCKLAPAQIDALRMQAQRAGLPSDTLVLTGFVTDDELISLYRICKLFVFPSWHEGFGLPLLEAMSCGRAVLAGNQSAMPEVVGTQDALFDSHDPRSIARKIADVLGNEEVRVALEAQALRHSKSFSWDKTAQHAITALEQGIQPMVHTTEVKPDAGLFKLISEIRSFEKVPQEEIYWMGLAKNLDCTFSPNGERKKRIFIDVTELARKDARTGIQRVVRSILLQWLKEPPDGYSVESVRAADCFAGYLVAKKFEQAFLGLELDKVEDAPIEFYAGDIFVGLDLQPGDVAQRAEFFEKMRVWGVQTKFVVYDLLPIQFPEFFGEGADAAHVRWLNVVCQSNSAICISRSVAIELQEYCKQKCSSRSQALNIDWFHLGADIDDSVPSLGLPESAESTLYKIKQNPSFLMVGTVEPRKGQNQILEVMEELWKNGVEANLVIVGKAGWKMDALAEKIKSHPELNKRLFWLNGVSDEYLSKLYESCAALLAASWGEGFGLPLIEAAQKNIPIIARDIPVFREVAGDGAFYFNESRTEFIAKKIEDWLLLFSQGNHPRPDQVKWQTWKASAKQLMKKVLSV